MDVDKFSDVEELPAADRTNKKRNIENEQVAAHYNSRGNQTFKLRKTSPIIEVRKVNNFVKSVLILEFSRRGDFVLDIGGGKGGDLNKWHKAQVDHLVLADVAEGSVKDAVERYNDAFKRGGHAKFRFSVTWIAMDCCSPLLRTELDRVDFFDVVACQFALHYAFETEERTREFLKNVAHKLRPGGYFIGITTDARVLFDRAQASADLKSFGNSQYEVVFDEEVQNIKNGQRYVFSLEDAVSKVPEYVVDPQVLIANCEALDLELIRFENLQALYTQSVNSKRFGNLAADQKLPRSATEFQPDTWETIGLYLSFVFRKKGKSASTEHSVRFPLQAYSPSDVITLKPQPTSSDSSSHAMIAESAS
jgi:mRNA (guanine-N7-)-methyltransferase